MNNNIKEPYCPFEVSKLLKNKGFGVPTLKYYMGSGKIYTWEVPTDGNHKNFTKEIYSAPTHALAIEWVRINFEVYISPSYAEGNKKYGYQIFTLDDSYMIAQMYSYSSPEEAAEAGLLYVIENLIYTPTDK